MTENSFTWTGMALRPFAPCHLSLEVLPDASLRFAWIRRARIGGDPWDASEPPLSEATELYRLDILSGGAVVRSITASAPTADYAAADQAIDFPAGTPSPLSVQVRQISDVFGPGAPLARSM